MIQKKNVPIKIIEQKKTNDKRVLKNIIYYRLTMPNIPQMHQKLSQKTIKKK